MSLILFLCMDCLGLGAATSAVERPLVEVLGNIQEAYQVVFSYNAKDVKNINIRFVRQDREDFESAINRALENTGLKYKSVGLNFYVIYKNTQSSQRTIKKIQKKVDKIKKLSNEDFFISEKQVMSKVSSDQQINTITGQVTSISGEPLIGATVYARGARQGVVTDVDGNFVIKVSDSVQDLYVSYTGYETEALNVEGRNEITVQLKEGLSLNVVTVIGSRGVPRTRFDSSVPIDNITVNALNETGKFTLDDQLSDLVPSFNSGQHPVSDASAHINPIDLRGLLPSRTLVLVNGKRKNASALLYSYVTASRGEVGVDLKSIGSASIHSVEVLRDGAAAQYGSDAIAGVINLQLKEKIDPFFNSGYSTTSELDGTQFNAAGGFSVDILKSGYATFTAGYQQQYRTQRAGTVTSAADEAAQWGTSIFSVEDFSNYLERNPMAGFQVGLPDMRLFNASVNAGYTINEEIGTKIYAFGTLMKRSGKSPQFARGPYWVQGFEALYPGEDYFLPEMAPQIADQMMTVGIQHEWLDWNIDLSATYGNSRIDYFIKNSFNQSLGSASPKDFYNGAHQFSHLVNNLDLHKTFYPKGVEMLNVAFGMEHRVESFKGYSGEFASYGDGTPNEVDRIGSESFSGLSPKDAVSGLRNNIGFYTEITSDITSRLQIGGAARLENYSDFGANVSWKLNGLYKLVPNKLNIRSAISNGFRAPSLHQIHFTSTTTTLTPNGVVQNRILNNRDPALAILKIPKLLPETSLNLSMGGTYKLTDKISFSLDAYRIDVFDRIVLSGQIGVQTDVNSPINNLLETTNTNSAGFFLNAVNTSTQGVDLVLNLQSIELGNGLLNSSVAANFNSTKVTDINLPSFIEGNALRDVIFSREDISRFESWRPREKIMFSNTYVTNKITTTLSFNYSGSVSYEHPTNPSDDATYGSKIITNISIAYNINQKLKWQFGVNNLFNVYPDSFLEAYQDTPEDRNIDFVGRFQYPWQTIQIGIDGMRAHTSIAFQF